MVHDIVFAMLTVRSATRVSCLVVAVAALSAGQISKRPLTHRDFDSWRSITAQQLSPDGRWLAYAYMPQEGDGDLVVRDLASGKEYRENAGALPPPPVQNPAEANPEAEPPRRTLVIRFTSDSQFVIASTFPTKAETDQSKKDRRRADDLPKNGAIVVKLADGSVTRIAGVKNFQTPEKGGAWAAFQKEGKPEERRPDPAKPETAKPAGDEDQQRGRSTAGAANMATGARPEFGTDLVLRDLTKGEASDRSFADVVEFLFARDGKSLLYAVGSRNPEENGVFIAVPGSDAATTPVLAGKGRYMKLAWDREQTQAAFISNRDAADVKPARFKVYRWDRKTGSAEKVVAGDSEGFPTSLVVSDKGTLAFSRDGRKLYISASKPGAAEVDSAGVPSVVSDEKVQMDLWRWNDDLVQPMQRIRANAERARTFRGVYHIAEKRFVQLGSDAMPNIVMSDDGRQALGSDDRAYRRMVDYDGTYADQYWIDAMTGEKKLVVKKLRTGGFGGGGVQWSPDAKFALYYSDANWHLFSPSAAEPKNLTAGLPVSFADEEDDTPDPPSSNGLAGWAKDSKSAIVYDRYDVWQVFVDGRAPVNLTGGAGRRDKIVYRVQRIEPVDDSDPERGLDLTKPLTLRGVSDETRDSGFFRVRAGSTKIERLMWGPRNYTFAGRAKDADALLITASRFNEFPDLYLTDSSFANPRKATNGGAQLDRFLWGTAETVHFRNIDGVRLKATLFKPENFDPSRKYPMIVYIYERLSQMLHTFSPPQPGTSINVPFYVSNGYLVLTPDIVYTAGYPGQSALKCVLPAIDAVVDKGFVDEAAIGIQGHSWGGYQIAYMVTQTNRFRAAEAGAPVGNMTSAYSGIRWGTGLPRQFQYEQTQSRIGVPLYKNPQRYIENSPVFYAERVKTPLLILHNDQDDAVPWYQGIELFLALRRNEKEAYLLSYNGEFHGLRRRHNQKDYTVRMQQFFDHFLKGAPRPDWMEKGVPYLDRDMEKESFRKLYTGEQ